MVDRGRVTGAGDVSWAAVIGDRGITGRRKWTVGAGAKHRLVFVDRLATLVHLRHAVTHDVLACWFGVVCWTITRAIGEVWSLLAERGCSVSRGVRLTEQPRRGHRPARRQREDRHHRRHPDSGQRPG
ncbi:transposase family protein, partial [Streptomyces sp. CoH17]|uniref:transposase family protein n=1 Tax=Streptomyces sp. CoH17 TaxID=2992806 RepID=UPI003B63EA3D